MAPNCQIINFTSDSSDWIRELLLGSADKTESPEVWRIETKYYKADVQLQFVDCDDLLSLNIREDFEDTEAVIFNCVNSKFCLEQSEKVWDRLREFSPAVCLYVVPTASDVSEAGEVTRTEILDWCLTNQFELVQCDDEEDEEGDEFDEREGKVRIVSALKAHTWSNLRLEEETGPRPPPSIPAPDTEDDINFESLKNLGLEDDEDEDINFEDLYSQLSKMKDISKNLPESERKAYAEKVAIAFYKSMGGSDSETES